MAYLEGLDRLITLEVALFSKTPHAAQGCRSLVQISPPFFAEAVRHTVVLSCRSMMQQNAKGPELFI